MDEKRQKECRLIVAILEAREYARRKNNSRPPSDTEEHLTKAEQDRILPHVPGPYVTKPGFSGSYRSRHKDIKEVSREVLLDKRDSTKKGN